MVADTEAESTAWSDAVVAATLFAIDPRGSGGIEVRAHAGPVRDRWLALVRAQMPLDQPLRRVPLHVADGRLLGGLDLAATLQAGRPVAERGILAEADGGVVVLAMAERLSAGTSAKLVAAMDAGKVTMERDGVALNSPARIGVIALDEGIGSDERLHGALLDRLAFHLDLSGVTLDETAGDYSAGDAVIAARTILPGVTAGGEVVEALCSTAMALGIASIRGPLLALNVARASAALEGRTVVEAADAALAGRLVLAPRATVIPELPPNDKNEPAPSEEKTEQNRDDENVDQSPATEDRPLEDMVLEAATAAIPAGLLAQLKLAAGGQSRAQSAGRAGLLQRSTKRGRPIGVQRGELRAGARLNVLETLRAAAPWQGLRRRTSNQQAIKNGVSRKIEVRRDDFRISRFKQHTETTTIFVVDASGSAALHRLAEAKGAVELLLADCYVRRDRVALIAFRGHGAELLLPPTRSLARAKRSLAGLPGGGGTPLASGIEAALVLAEAIRRRGETPTIVLLTDGRANIGRDGAAGRSRAEEEALVSARMLGAGNFSILFVDTSPRPQPQALQLATAMRARYLALPYAGAAIISQAVKNANVA